MVLARQKLEQQNTNCMLSAAQLACGIEHDVQDCRHEVQFACHADVHICLCNTSACNKDASVSAPG